MMEQRREFRAMSIVKTEDENILHIPVVGTFGSGESGCSQRLGEKSLLFTFLILL